MKLIRQIIYTLLSAGIIIVLIPPSVAVAEEWHPGKSFNQSRRIKSQINIRTKNRAFSNREWRKGSLSDEWERSPRRVNAPYIRKTRSDRNWTRSDWEWVHPERDWKNKKIGDKRCSGKSCKSTLCKARYNNKGLYY